MVSLILFIILTIYIIIYPPGKSKAAADPVVAKVNGVEISKSRLYDALVSAGGEKTLDTMISEELVSQEGKKAGFTITDEELNQELESLKKSFSSEEEFNQALTYYGMTLDGLKKNMNSQVMLRKLLEPQVTVTDDDVKTYYDENAASFITPEQMRASHILVKTKEEAETVLAELKNGTDFATLAKEKSTDTSNKDTGGDLGFFSKGNMEKSFEDAAFALKTGELSGIVETSYGFHVIKATDHKDAATPTFEEKKSDIREKLVTDKISTLSNTWIQDKKSAATIENYLK